MKKKTVIILTSVLLLLLLSVIIITYIIELRYFTIILSVLFVVLTLIFIFYVRENDDNFNKYISERNRILNDYKDLIDRVDGIPSLKNRDIIKLVSFEELLKVAKDGKIRYKNDNDSSFFLLLKDDEAYYYIMKIDDNVISPTEELIKYMKNDTEDELEGIEHTIEYKLDELHSYNISPIRNKKKVEIKDDSGIKDYLEDNKEKED
ncbi:MAG: hypothetical protein IKQ29_00230 [Bacilli bacterium]|nr:hypothetical protein [Bacilli bacterium]